MLKRVNVKTFSTSTKQKSYRQPVGAVVVELKDAVLLRVSEVDATLDAVECELLWRQEIMAAVYDSMHRAVHVRRADRRTVEMTV